MYIDDTISHHQLQRLIMQEPILKMLYGGEWKQHDVYPSYFFSNEGKVAKSTPSRWMLIQGIPVGRYTAISLAAGNGIYKREYLHRIICRLFNGKPTLEEKHCRHLDCNSKNNHSSNLKWGTAKENIQDSIRNGKIKSGESNPMAKLTKKQALEMRTIRENTDLTYKQIGKMFGVSRMTACRVINKDTWK